MWSAQRRPERRLGRPEGVQLPSGEASDVMESELLFGFLAAEPAAMLAERSIVHDYWNAHSFGFGGSHGVNDAVLHPDIFDAHLYGLIHHRGH